MKKAIIVLLLLFVQYTYGQTLIGINADIGKSNYVNKGGRSTLSSGNAWSGGINFHFSTAKRFNPLLGIGFNQKSYSSHEYIHNIYPPDFDVTEVRTYKALYLNLGVRFNILDKKHKFFLDAAMVNNYILEQKQDFKLNDEPHTISYYKVGNPYYTVVMIGIGYNYNNKFSISGLIKPALTSFDINYQTTRLNTYCINLCYFLPILGNKKLKPVSNSTE